MNLSQLILLSLKLSILLSVFVLGLAASSRDVTYLFRHPKQLVRSLLPMYVIMPLVAAVIVSIFSNLNPAVKIALITLSVSPIPPILPKKQLKVGGRESYVIGLLVAISLLAIIVVPLVIELFELAFNRSAQIPPAVVARLILATVLIPLAIGLAVRYALPAFAERIAKPLSIVASILLAIASLFILFNAMPAIISLIGNGTVLAIIIFVLIGLAVGHSFGGPDPDNKTALALSTVSRHPGIAIAIANINFPEQKLALAAILLYLLLSAVVTIPYLKSRPQVNQGAE